MVEAHARRKKKKKSMSYRCWNKRLHEGRCYWPQCQGCVISIGLSVVLHLIF